MTSIQTSPGQEGQSPLRAQLQELIGSMRVAQLLSVAATLGIADQLTEGPKRLDELSAMVWYRAVLDGGWRTMRSSAAALKKPRLPRTQRPAQSPGRRRSVSSRADQSKRRGALLKER